LKEFGVDALSTAEARDQFSDVINRAAYGKERIALTRRGKALVAVAPIEDVELLRELEDYYDAKAAEALEDVRIHGTIPWEQVKAELGSS
jgi:prevent-host-death family protein